MKLAFSEGKVYVVLCVAAIAVLAWLQSIWLLLPLAILIFILYFFRDPHRQVEHSPKVFYAPADGKVTNVRRVNCAHVGPASWEITIFMSPFNVHVNRSPADGKVKLVKHQQGRFLPAMKPNAPLENEQNIMLFDGKAKFKVVQIAGALARRTVCWVRPGDDVVQGQKIGMIKFSSCTQLVLPGNVKVAVKEGSVVRAGLTIIGGMTDDADA